MTMDYSRLHTYTPPQCAPENTGYTYSLSSSYSSAALEFEREHRIEPVFDSPRMSRRSLRLHTSGGLYGNDSPADSSHNHSGALSVGGAGRRETRTVRSRKQQSHSLSVSSSQSQSQSQSSSQTHSSLLGCAAGDSSRLSGLLDESCIRERTAVDSAWGLDGDGELKARSVQTERSVTRSNGDLRTAQTQSSSVNGYICKDCSIHLDRKEALTTYSTSCSSASSSSSSSLAHSASASASASGSALYYQDKSLKHKSGVLVALRDTCARYSRQAVTCVASLVSLLAQVLLLRRDHEIKGHESKGVLVHLTDTCLHYGRRALTPVVSLVSLLLKMGYKARDHGVTVVSEGAHSSYCGSMNVKDLVTGDGHLNLNGSLCDDCKGKQYLETQAIHTQSSRGRRLAGALWSVIAYTGYCLMQVVRTVGAAGLFVTRKLLSVLWLALVSPGKAATGAFWWLGTGWYQLVTLMSLFNVFILTRCLPRLVKLLLFLLPFLLLLGLWFWGPSSLLCYLPAINLTEWRTASSSLFPFPLTPAEEAVDTAHDHPATAPPPTVPQPAGVAVSVDTERLQRLEERLAQVWESVQRGGRLQEQQHGEALGLYHTLREQLDKQTDRDSLGLWVSGLLDQRLTVLRAQLQQDSAQREQTQDQFLRQQQSYEARLAELEGLLQVLAAKTEEVHQKQETATPAPVNVGVDREAHDALLLEVQRLEAELGRIRGDLQGVIGCRGKCEQLAGLQDTVDLYWNKLNGVSAQVSAQLKRELRTLFYGSDEGELPEPLLQWLSAQFVRHPDLQASLASLEQNILRNITLHLERSKQPPCAQAVTQTVVQATGDAGMSEEQVQLIVQNALKLYAQDRTGLVDYALESGGGSILSTRCSETYETKTALMSLFGVPLWYFSQSPRVVIQPDVYPGNCWAFKGSQGYLVIRLSMSVVPTAFCLEHIPKALSPTGNISSAPRQFTVYGLDDEYQDEGKLLGRYTYQDDGESLQTFPVTEENDKAYQIIEMRVLSNWGHPEYTCLYRFRVHGRRISE
ncbi:hypothetical protein MATL_G00218140 [Megalops atlanticus]|uniref:SUN domain-containing protein n=1 Tax=Megalops atlanticus TaxID=7932 RepID=A0A9D3SXH0_MEGAT|nr:hypothetical protein MATL_G00218140 [Megalops atlanticus]